MHKWQPGETSLCSQSSRFQLYLNIIAVPSEASDSDHFKSQQLPAALVEEPLPISALQQTVGKPVRDLNKIDE